MAHEIRVLIKSRWAPGKSSQRNGGERACEATQRKRKALDRTLDEAKAAAGDVVQLRNTRGNVITRYTKDKEKAAAQLAELEKGIDSAKQFSQAEQASFWNSQGAAYYRLRDYDNARRCFLKVAEKRPEDVTIRQTLFALALEFEKEADLDSAMSEVRKVAGSDTALYLYCVASRAIVQVERETSGKARLNSAQVAQLEEARTTLNQAMRSRPFWHELVRLLGRIDDLEGKYDEAVTNYQRSLELGPPNPVVMRRLVQLLYLLGRYPDVRDALSKMGTLSSNDPLNMIDTVIRLKDKDTEGAVAKAKQAIADDPDKAENYFFLGQIYDQLKQPDDAEQQYRLALEKDPESAQGWIMLVDHLARNSKTLEANAAIRDARTKLPETIAAAVLGPAYELVGDLKEAERFFLEAETTHPQDVGYVRNVASFYIRTHEREVLFGNKPSYV